MKECRTGLHDRTFPLMYVDVGVQFVALTASQSPYSALQNPRRAHGHGPVERPFLWRPRHEALLPRPPLTVTTELWSGLTESCDAGRVRGERQELAGLAGVPLDVLLGLRPAACGWSGLTRRRGERQDLGGLDGVRVVWSARTC